MRTATCGCAMKAIWLWRTGSPGADVYNRSVTKNTGIPTCFLHVRRSIIEWGVLYLTRQKLVTILLSFGHTCFIGVTQVAIRHALSHAGNSMQGPICLSFCHQVEGMPAFRLPPLLHVLSNIEHWKLRYEQLCWCPRKKPGKLAAICVLLCFFSYLSLWFRDV